MSAFSQAGLAQGINTGMQEATRGIIQGLEYKNRMEDRADKKVTDAQLATQQQDEYKLKFEKLALETNELRSAAAKKETYDGFRAYSETNDPRYLTELLKNPTIKKALPGALRYDNINVAEDTGLMEPLGLTEELLNKDPTRYVKATTDDGGVHIVDMYGAYAKTGYTAVARKEVIDNMKGDIAISKGKVDMAKDTITGKALSSGDPDTVMAALKLTDPELWLKVKQGGSVHMDAYTQAITAFTKGNPDATKSEIENFNSAFATKTVAGVGYVAQNKNVDDLTGGQKKANSLFTTEAASNPKWKDDAQAIQNDVISNLSSEQKTMVVEADKKLTSNNMTATMVEKLLKSPTTAKMSRGAIDNMLTYASKITGLKNDQALNNVDFNSRSGMIVAEFIKEISGTAAADAEVTRLMDVFLGGNLTDETYVKRAMAAFADQLRIKNNEIGKQYKQYLPYTVGTTTNLKPKSKQPQVLGLPTRELSLATEARIKQQGMNIKPAPSQGGKKSAADFWK